MSHIYILRAPCQVCDHPEAHAVIVKREPFDAFTFRSAFVTPEYCPKCRTIYSVQDMMELQAEIRGMVEEYEAEEREHRTGKRLRTA